MGKDLPKTTETGGVDKTQPGFAFTKNNLSSSVANADSYGQTETGSGTPFDVPKDIIWGWNWKESMPNAVVSQLTTFLCLWAVEYDYEDELKQDFKNPRLNNFLELLSNGYELSKDQKDLVDFGDMGGKKALPRIRPVNFGYQCKLNGSPVKYIPALPNIAQVLTKDAKGGVGIDRISLNNTYSNSMTVDVTMTIANPYELMEQASFWRFFTPGQEFLMTVGWQDEGTGYYNPATFHSDSGVLAKKFEEYPSKRVIPPIIDPYTNKLNDFFFDIDTNSPRYLYPAFGFWQSFHLLLQVPSFTMDGTKISGSIKFICPGQFIQKQVVSGQLAAGVSEFISKNTDKIPAIVTKMNSDVGFQDGTLDQDNIEKYQTIFIKLGYAIESIIRAYNSLLYKEGMEKTALMQQGLIFFSQDGNTRVGDTMKLPLVDGDGPEGLCNWWMGVGDGNGGNMNVESAPTPQAFSNVNKVVDHLLLIDAYKKESVYWHEGKQFNIQQAEKKELKVILEQIKTIADIPIQFSSYKQFLSINRAMVPRDMLSKFCDEFLPKQTGMAFHLIEMHNNIFYLHLADQFYKTSLQVPKFEVSQKIGLPDIALRKFILDEFRWKHFCLRFGDFQSLVSNMTAMQQLDVQTSIMNYKAAEFALKAVTLGEASLRAGGNEIYKILDKQVVRENISSDIKYTPTDAPKGGESQKVSGPNSGTITETTASPSTGASNATNKGYEKRSQYLHQLISMGLDPEIGGSVFSTIGSFLKGFMDQIDVTIHGTFGIYEMQLMYVMGTFEYLRGFYVAFGITHEISRGDFTTKFQLKYTGQDQFQDAPVVSFFDPVEGRLYSQTGTTVDDITEKAAKKESPPPAPTPTPETPETTTPTPPETPTTPTPPTTPTTPTTTATTKSVIDQRPITLTLPR